ncbi:MAG: hypothetical protein K2G27_07470 [Duncaniella sp.]|nr:hypothetical protein [Duncaniella sp.]
MRFELSADARKATEMSVGVTCEKMMRTPLDRYENDGTVRKDSRGRQVKSRGSVYLQLGRMASVDRFKNVISKF